MKIIIAPGAFKGSLSPQAAAEAIERGLRRSQLEAELIRLPLADGGDGTLDAFLANGGLRVRVPVVDPLQRPMVAEFGLLPDGETAIIEMARASGLALLRPGELNPLVATTYGTGQLMQAALERGVRRMIVGLGGSATVDGGAGALMALGVGLRDAYGEPIPLGGAGLSSLASIDRGGLDLRWQTVELIIASDVTNPAVGDEGAAEVFGPQKGAGPHEVRLLEAALRHSFGRVRDQLGVDVLTTPGGGAAGAFAAGLMAFLGGRIESGVDLLLDFNGFDDHLQTANVLVTGEGRMDGQTIYGKGPIGAARRAKAAGLATIALVGGLAVEDSVLREAGMDVVLPIVPRPMGLDEAMREAASLVEQTALRLGWMLRL